MRTTIICDPAILKTSQVNEQQMENRENRYIKRKRTEIDPPMDGSDFQQPVKCMRTYMGNLYNQQEHQYEFVNVMFDSNLLPVQNPIISEANSANLAEFSANWSTNDLLDLDQKTPSYGQQTHLDTFTPDSGHRHTKNPVSSEPNNQMPSEDLEDKNLSWLFNFKLDELPHLSPEVNRTPSVATTPRNNSSTKKIDEIIQEATAGIDDEEMNVAENVIVENPNRIQKKPPFTYTELIEYALEDRGELTVSGIYQWISDRFPYYKSNDDRWKNSVRHNLSINPHFRKGSKAPQGAGHLWTISSRDSEANNLAWEHKKQRLELFFKMEAAHSPAVVRREVETAFDETAAATASILPPQERQSPENQATVKHPESLATFYTPQDPHQMPFDVTDSSDDLRRVAGEILNGVRRNVEVQIVHPGASFALESTGDYLNPLSKDEIVQESGLRSMGSHGGRGSDLGNDYFVTEIDPIELGINMTTNGDEEVLFGDDFNLNYFGIGTGSNIVA
ncbi:forkhead box protein D3-like isoform X2 [Phlebotomus papatasi]|uniref:forkhead box protein D3-like isoform X2 n=1 Tax=Phlebotomus papatasi TaxID=29031 RepID=UPI00248377D2|nr:forkhead box protein D3-like isoform X2 [Phlebotomus papatasi]